MKSFINYAEETVNSYTPTNIKCHRGSKYSLFNREFMFAEKYHPDPEILKNDLTNKLLCGILRKHSIQMNVFIAYAERTHGFTFEQNL